MCGKERWLGVPFGVVALVFLALRLCGAVSWSWVWVLAPLWVYGILFLCVWAYLIVAFIRLLLNR